MTHILSKALDDTWPNQRDCETNKCISSACYKFTGTVLIKNKKCQQGKNKVFSCSFTHWLYIKVSLLRILVETTSTPERSFPISDVMAKVSSHHVFFTF